MVSDLGFDFHKQWMAAPLKVPDYTAITRQMYTRAPAFVVVGPGRSGTTYISHVLKKVGIFCGHEEWFTPHFSRRREGMDGDSGWMVIPGLDLYPGKVLVQGRDPLRVVGSQSVHHGGKFMRGETEDVFWLLMQHALPQLNLRADHFYNSAMWYIACYTKALKHADMYWRVEDLTPSLLVEITTRIGKPASLEDCRFAIETTRTDTHTPADGPTRDRARSLQWSDIGQPVRGVLQELAREMGY